MIKVSVRNRPYATAELRHYAPSHFNTNIAPRIIGAGNVSWSNASGQQSCAMRMSIALAYAGIHWPKVTRSWQLKDTNVFFPSYAADYPELLQDREEIDSEDDITDRQGVIFFGGGFGSASGHVTLWNGDQCHHNDAYWDQPTIYFWEMT